MILAGLEFSLDTITGYRSQFLKDQTIVFSKNLISIIISMALLLTLALGYLYHELIITVINFLMVKMSFPGFTR
jgi:hypothetical protein